MASGYANGLKTQKKEALGKIPRGYQQVVQGKTLVGDLYWDNKGKQFQKIPDRDVGTRVKGFVVVVRNKWLNPDK